MMTLILLILFLACACFTMFIAWRFNENVENVFIKLSVIFAVATAIAFVAEIIAEAEKMGVRIELDDSNNSVGKKIRSAEKSKVPYSVVVGEKEVESGVLPVRIRGDLKVDDKPVEYSVADLMAAINRESAERSRTSTL